MSEVFRLYSQYTGTGIIMVLFFTALVYMALKEKDKSVRTIIIYSTITIVLLILFPPVYYLYSRFVDEGTYWRMWWIIPTGIGMAYASTVLVEQHRLAGLLLTFVILLLGGEFVYVNSNGTIAPSENAYQIPQVVIDITEYVDEYEDNKIFYAAFPPELLTYVRQYDVNYQMPYGREMLDTNWGGDSSFYEAMAADPLDFSVLMEHCQHEKVRFIVVDKDKSLVENPEDFLFRKLNTFGQYDLYEYIGIDWEPYFERINSTAW